MRALARRLCVVVVRRVGGVTATATTSVSDTIFGATAATARGLACSM